MMMVDSLAAALRRMLFFALLCALPALAAGPVQAKVRTVHRAKITSHVDRAPKTVKRHARRRARTAALASTWGCTEQFSDRAPYLSNAPQIKVIYAYAAGASDNLAIYGDVIQSDAVAVENKVADESGNTKSVRFDVGGTGGAGDVCTNDSRNRLDIQTVQLAREASYYTDGVYEKLIPELTTKIKPADPNQRVNYVVYLDNVHPDPLLNALGVADLLDDSTHGYDSPINQGRNGRGQLFAFVFGYGGSDFNGGQGVDWRRKTFLHEMSHTLGAVQFNAPHTSGAGHCYDDADIMCYDDGGPWFANNGLEHDCVPGSDAFGDPLDCNKDDYFNANPADGSYLATNWNEYDSVFLCPVSQCDTALPAFPVTLSASRDGQRFTLTADTGGVPIEHHEWNVSPDRFFEVDSGSTPTIAPLFPTPGTTTVELRAVKADGSFAYASMPVTLHEPVASLTVSGTRLTNSTITLDGSGTSDPDGLIQHYRWDLDSNNTFETDTGLSPVAATSYATPGTKTAGLQIDYGLGFVQTFTNFNIAAPPASAGPVTPSGAAPPSISALSVRIAKLLKSGLPLSVRCNAACVVQFTLSIDATTARRFHLRTKRGKPVVIARVRGQFIAGTVKPVMKLSASAKSALRKARKFTATLSGLVDQTGVRPLTVKKALPFRR